MNLERLTKKNFLLFAAQAYRNPRFLDITEFKKDVQRIQYALRMVRKYQRDGNSRTSAIINHLIPIYNNFELDAATAMILFKSTESDLRVLKPILIFLNRITEYELPNIQSDPIIVEELKRL